MNLSSDERSLGAFGRGALGLGLAATICLMPAVSSAEDSPAADVEAEDPAPKFEVTFGSSKLFRAPDQGEEALPISSALFLVEYFLSPRWHLITAFNLPLTADKAVFEDGRVVERYAPSSLMLGVGASAVGWDFRKTSRVEVQLGAFAGRVLSKEGRFFPMTVARVHLLKDQGFGIYVGTAFAFRVDTLALIYGVGHRF